MERFGKVVLTVVGMGLAVQASTIAWAAEATTASASSQSSVAQVVTPAADASAPAIRPIVIMFSGEIVNAGSDTLTVRDRYGVTKEMLIDASKAKVMRGTAPMTVTDLKSGDQVTVDYVYDVSTGKRNVQTIAIAEASTGASAGMAPAQTSSAAPAAQSSSVPTAKQ